jgi:hypothetical protein
LAPTSENEAEANGGRDVGLDFGQRPLV